MTGRNLLGTLATFVLLVPLALKAGPAALGALLILAALLAMLWTSRLIHDSQRSRARTQPLATVGAEPLAYVRPLEREIAGLTPALRDWLMRGFPTGATEFWVRDAWQRRLPGAEILVFELHTTPGFAGFGIPVWRERHGAVLWRLDDPLPSFVIQSTRRGPSIAADDPEIAAQVFAEMRADYALPEAGEVFAFCNGRTLLAVLRRQPLDGIAMARILAG